MYPRKRAAGNKFLNKKQEVDGVKFDSKLELFFYNLLKSNDIHFDFQVKLTLQEKLVFNLEKIREIYMKIDFVVYHQGVCYFVDTKGFPTPEAKIKYKMLRHKIKIEMDETVCRVLFIKNQSSAKDFIKQLLENENSRS